MTTKIKDESKLKAMYKDSTDAPASEKGRLFEEFLFHLFQSEGYYVLKASEADIYSDMGADLFISKTRINPDLTSESLVAFVTVSLKGANGDSISKAEQTSRRLNIINFLIVGPHDSFSRGTVIDSALIWDLHFLCL